MVARYGEPARIVAFPVHTKRKSMEICHAFVEGVPALPGLEARVFYGVTEVNEKNWRYSQNSETPFYYIDNSYFDRTRGTHYRVSKNTLQLQGPYASSGERWRALRYKLKPWRDPEGPGHVLIVPQSDTYLKYTMLSKSTRQSWTDEQVATAKATWPGREIRVREWSADKLAQAKTLKKDLVGCVRLITHSSAAAVEAVIEGVHVTFDSGSPSAIANMSMGDDGHRLKYLCALADNQWTLDEIRRGKAWRWLNR